VPLLTRQALEGWCKGGVAGQACLAQLHQYLGALVCGIGGWGPDLGNSRAVA
jgi:hypothetical protein